MNFKKNVTWNLLGSGLPLLAAALFIPYTLRLLTTEGFGLLTLIWVLIGYFSLFDLGIGRALTYQLSTLRDKRLNSEITGTLRAGLLLTFLTGVIGGTIIYLASSEIVDHWLNINVAWRNDALLALKISALGIVFTTITSGLRGAQEGLDKFFESNLSKVALGFCMFALPAFSIWIHGPTLWIITIYLVAIRAFILLIGIIQLRKYLFSNSGNQTIKKCIKPLFSFGIWVTLSAVISPMMIYGDRFIVGAFAGVDLLTYYAIPQEALQRLLIIPVAIGGALMPHFAGIKVEDRLVLYKKHYKKTAKIMLLLCALALLFFYPIFSIWISAEFAFKALPIAIILIIGIWFNAAGTIPYVFFHANGDTKLTACFHLLELGFYVLILYFLIKVFGLPGAALAWTLRAIMDFTLLNFAMKKRYFSISRSEIKESTVL